MAVCPANWKLSAPTNIAVDEHYRVVVEASDLDGDGQVEIVTTTAEDVVVFSREETFEKTGTFKDDNQLRGGGDIELADWNGDGVLDVVVEHESAITCLQGDKKGGFLPGVLIGKTPSESSRGTYSRLRVADLDRDGALDAVLGTNNVGTLVVFYGNGTGGLKRTVVLPIYDGSVFDDFVLADVNDDGFLDAIGVGSDHGPYVHYSDAGELVPEGEPFGEQQEGNIDSIEAGDVDGDGETDLVISGGGNAPVDLIILRHSTGYEPERIESYEVPDSFAIADVTGDGFADIVVTHGGWEKIGVYVQCGGQLQPEKLFPAPYSSSYPPSGVAVGQLDDDDCPDVVIADYDNGLVFFHGSGCTRR